MMNYWERRVGEQKVVIRYFEERVRELENALIEYKKLVDAKTEDVVEEGVVR